MYVTLGVKNTFNKNECVRIEDAVSESRDALLDLTALTPETRNQRLWVQGGSTFARLKFKGINGLTTTQRKTQMLCSLKLSEMILVSPFRMVSSGGDVIIFPLYFSSLISPPSPSFIFVPPNLFFFLNLRLSWSTKINKKTKATHAVSFLF